MHILFLTRSYGERAGGMERLSYEMIQAVSQQPGVSVSVVAHKGSRATSPFFNLTALPKAISLAKHADVIHLGDPMLSFLGWLLKFLTKKPIAVTIHGLDITYPNFLYQIYLKLFFTKFDRYLPISQYVQELLMTHYSLPVARTSVLTPGITDRFLDPAITRQQLSQLLKRDVTNTRVLFTSGRLIKRKGHAWFIREVLPHLPENVIYVIAGDGPELGHLLTKERSTEDRVRFLGRVSDKQLKVLYNTVDAFIMPNIPVENDVEGFGLVLLEAGLCQRPVFASNVDGIPDAIHDGHNGTLLPAQNPQAWISALQDFLTHPKPNPAAREYTLQHFNWETKAQAYLGTISAKAPLLTK